MQARSAYRVRDTPSRVLTARGLTKSFARGLARAARRTVALDDVDIDLRVGELVGLVGCEGAGKTTLLQCLCGLLKRDRGIIELSGEPFEGGGCPPQISYVPAVPVFYPFLTVRDVLEFRVARDAFSPCREAAVDSALSALGLHAESRCRISVLPREVIKRLAVAEALIGEPGVILVDTAVSDMCQPFTSVTLDALQGCAFAGVAVVIAAREASSIAAAASRILFIDQGRIGRAFSLDPQAPVAEDPGLVPATSLFVAERVH